MPRLITVLTRVLLVAALWGYGSWLLPMLAPYAGGSDSTGYLWSGRLFHQGRISEPIRRPAGAPTQLAPGAFAPLGANVRPGHEELVATYPPGLPLLVAAAMTVAPAETAIRGLLLTIMLVTVWLMYRAGRAAGLTRLWAAGAAALLAASPLFVFMGVQPLSDVLSTLWAIAVVVLAWRARRVSSSAVWAGAALGLATLTRPTNIFLVLPALVALPFSWDRLWRFAVGGLPLAVFLGLYQTLAYGGPLSSGYGNMRSAFALAHLGPTLRHYAIWIPSLASWLIVLAPLGWLYWRGLRHRWMALTLVWVAAVLGPYALYFHTSETWWYLRFVLPAFPPLIIAAIFGCQHTVTRLTTRLSARSIAMVMALACIGIAGTAVRALLRHPFAPVYKDTRQGEREYRDALRWLAIHESTPRPILMVQLSGAANYYAPHIPLIRFDRVSADDWQAIRAWQRETGTVLAAAVLPFEEKELLGGGADGRLQCAWRVHDSYRQVRFWECPP